MLTTISGVDRAPIGGDLLSGPDAGRLEAFASFVAYSGTFRVEGTSVVHTVEMSLFPDWVGSEQRRSVELSADGQRLTLSTQRDVVLLLVEKHLSRHILEHIGEVGEFDVKPGTGIAVMIDVEDAVGVVHQVQELKDIVEENL